MDKSKITKSLIRSYILENVCEYVTDIVNIGNKYSAVLHITYNTCINDYRHITYIKLSCIEDFYWKYNRKEKLKTILIQS